MLVDNIHRVLRTLVFSEEQVSSTDERWFVVRIMPYRTQDNRIDGVVIIFSDITDRKDIEEKALNKALSQLQTRFNLKDEELNQTKIDLKNKIGLEESEFKLAGVLILFNNLFLINSSLTSILIRKVLFLRLPDIRDPRRAIRFEFDSLFK